MTDEGAPAAERAQTEVGKSTDRWRRRVVVAGLVTVAISAGVVLPPLINIGRYRHRVTELMTRSFGRPVHLSNVELRLLPWPGFVLHDLSVSEDSAFGAEPILSARTVVASVRLLSLWRGRLEISQVSVDEASLNLVRTTQGRWNLESLMIGAQPALTGHTKNGSSNRANPPDDGLNAAPGGSFHFPYLQATESRVNLKDGTEKSPFSLVDADLSLWQDEPGEWRVRLKGQPVRTDMEMSSADAGEVRMEASLRSAAQLHEMPLKLQMEWRDAQLGQLSRLLFGSDAGWRGDLTADIDLQGKVDNAQTRTRLRATGVRRAEFAPETPLDFDANCSFRYQHSRNAFHDIGCDTALGDGRLHLKAELPGTAGMPEGTLEVRQVPLQAGLDLLRTVRGGFAPGISVRGTASGSLAYKEAAPNDGARTGLKALRHRAGAAPAALGTEDPVPANLRGTIAIDGAQVRGGGFKEPIELPKMVWVPVALSGAAPRTGSGGDSQGLGTRFTIALGAPAAPSRRYTQPPSQATQTISVVLELGAKGFDTSIGGSGSISGLRDLAYGFGLPHLAVVDGFTAGTADFDFSARGPWLASQDFTDASTVPVAAEVPVASLAKKSKVAPAKSLQPEVLPGQESVSGSAQLHHAQWMAAYLAQPVELGQAAMTVSAAGVGFASDFSYGGKDGGKDVLRGSVAVNEPANCKAALESGQNAVVGEKADGCELQMQLRFGALDADAVQVALLGAPKEKTLLSPLLDRMRSADRPKWPEISVSAQADTLLLGSVALLKPTVRLRFKPNEVLVEDWQAGLLGGSAKGTGRFAWTGDRPDYAFQGSFIHLNAAPVGALMESRWTGGPVSGDGKIALSGLTGKELTASALGEVHFDWQHGSISTGAKDGKEMRFDDWSGVAAIQGGKATVGKNAMTTGSRSTSVAGAAPLGGPVNLTVVPGDGKAVAGAGKPAGSSSAPPAVR